MSFSSLQNNDGGNENEIGNDQQDSEPVMRNNTIGPDGLRRRSARSSLLKQRKSSSPMDDSLFSVQDDEDFSVFAKVNVSYI